MKNQAHEKSGGNEVGDFGTDHAGFGKMEGGLNVGAGEFRIAFEQGIPGFAFGKLAENDSHRDARAFDHGPAATDARVEFNVVVHGEERFQLFAAGLSSETRIEFRCYPLATHANNLTRYPKQASPPVFSDTDSLPT